MLRAWLALGAGIGCGVVGMRRASALRRRARELRRWLEALQRLSLLLDESASTLPRAFEQAGESGGTAQACLTATAERLKQAPGLTPSQAFMQAGLKYLDWATGEERAQLTAMLAGVGRGSLAMRRQAVEHTAEWLSLHLGWAEEKHRKDGKLALTLGWAAGACLTLLLI